MADDAVYSKSATETVKWERSHNSDNEIGKDDDDLIACAGLALCVHDLISPLSLLRQLIDRERAKGAEACGEDPVLESAVAGMDFIERLVLSVRDVLLLPRHDVDGHRCIDQGGLRKALSIIADLMDQVAKRDGVELKLNLHHLPSIPEGKFLKCTGPELLSLYYNLLSNAIDSTHEKMDRDPTFKARVEMKSSIVSEQESGQDVVSGIQFSIKDNGVGLSEGDTKNFIERVRAPLPKGVANPSLGLKNIRSVLSNTGARWRFNSRLGAGSEFNFLIPFGEVED